MYSRRRSKHFQLSRLVFIMNLIYTFSTFSPLAFKVWTNHLHQKQNVGKQNFRIYQPIVLYSICSFVRYFLKGILCYINDSICSCTWKQLILHVKLCFHNILLAFYYCYPFLFVIVEHIARQIPNRNNSFHIFRRINTNINEIY